MRFKTFLEARKKAPETLSGGRAFDTLRDMQNHLTWHLFEIDRLQLFVPKRIDPAERLKRQRDWRYYTAAKEVTEDRPPVLVNYVPRAGGNKPNQGLWTSTARKGPGGTHWSDWLKFMRQNFKSWVPSEGYLLKIEGEPRVFDLSYAEQFYFWAQDQDLVGKDEPSGSSYLRVHFPWDLLAKYFDAAHHSGYSDSDSFTYGWDVESTVWFNTSHLKYVGSTKLTPPKDDND
jgi:hypothetical protein